MTVLGYLVWTLAVAMVAAGVELSRIAHRTTYRKEDHAC